MEKTRGLDNKIKVIHIMQSAGGVAEYVKDLLNNMNSEKYENIVIASYDYKEYKKISNENCNKIYYLDMIREISPKKDLKAIIQINKIIRQEKPDIIYMHSSKAGALGRMAVMFNKKVKTLYNAHGWYFNAEIGKKKCIYQWIEKILAYKTDKIIAISRSEYESAIQKNICKKNKIILIENGIDIEKYRDYEKYREGTRKKYKIEEDSIVVGIVGRISEQKDPITTIKAASEIIKENKNIYFMFVGAGNLEQEVLTIAKKEKIENNIIITGWVDKVKEYISAFDIALLPSKWEGFGLAILEYMICKKPIIATRIGGIADILNNSNNAFFVKKESPSEIVESIYKILKNKEINKITEENYTKCKEKFSIKRVADETEQLYEKILFVKGRRNGSNKD